MHRLILDLEYNKQSFEKIKKIYLYILTFSLICYIIIIVVDRQHPLWEHSSAGRASALQAEGHRFEPCCSHHFFGPVVQLVRTLACHARGRRFEPDPGRQKCGCSSSGRAPPCQGGGSGFEPRHPLHIKAPKFRCFFIL